MLGGWDESWAVASCSIKAGQDERDVVGVLWGFGRERLRMEGLELRTKFIAACTNNFGPTRIE